MDNSGEWVIITRTGARPLRFRRIDWPIVAEGRGDDYSGPDDARKSQEWADGKFSRFRITVRRSGRNGRWLVCGVRMSVNDEWRGADIVTAEADIADAVKRFGAAMGAPACVVQAALDNLPPINLPDD